MELNLQFGYGMMEHCRVLLKAWKGGTVVLSPRDLDDSQLRRLAADIAKIQGGRTMLDPQFYVPHADHERLCSHRFWPAQFQTGAFWQGPALATLLRELASLNTDLQTSAMILPGQLAAAVDDDWLATQRMVIEESNSITLGGGRLMTIALSSAALQSQAQVEALIADCETWPVDVGCYLVSEHPNGKYLSDDPSWLANLLDLSAALRITGRTVILAYSNHQTLIAACAKVNAIASGTWMNVRSFPPDKFRTAYDDEIKQRATWYYCAQALSEYKIPFLDIAQRQNVLDRMAPPAGMGGGHADVLFRGAQPTSVGFSEQAAFRHYLECLRQQALASTARTFDETISQHERMLDAAEVLLSDLTSNGVRGQLRDYSEIVDVNRAALAVFVAARGPTLRRAWSSL